jgi:hypothetical protein
MIKILHTEPFLPLGKAIPKPAPAAPKAVEIKPGIWQAPDGKLETRDPTPMVITPIPAPSSNLAEVCAEAVRQLEAVCGTALIGFKPAETPLPVVPNALGDGWIAWCGGECPIQGSQAGTYQVQLKNGEVENGVNPDGRYPAQQYGWRCGVDGGPYSVVAYRLIP